MHQEENDKEWIRTCDLNVVFFLFPFRSKSSVCGGAPRLLSGVKDGQKRGVDNGGHCLSVKRLWWGQNTGKDKHWEIEGE